MKKCFLYRIDVLKKILPYTERIKTYIGICLALGAAILAADLLQVWIYGVFIDQVVLGRQFGRFPFVVLVNLLIYGFTALCRYGDYSVKINFGNAFMLKIKERVLQYYFDLPHSEYDSLDIGEAKMRIEDDSSHLRSFIDSQLIGLCVSCITFLVCTILLFTTEWRLACYSVIVIPSIMAVDSKLSKREQKLNEQNRTNDANMSSWLQESMNGWREIKALCLEKRQERTYSKFLRNFAMYYGEWIHYWTARVLVIPQLRDTLLTKFGLYFLGGLLIIRNQMRIGDLLVFALYFEKLSGAVKGISGTNAELIANMPHTTRITEQLDLVQTACGDYTVPSCCEIRLCKVCFTYPNAATPVLNNMDLVIKKGDRIAIVGKSGSGKSTLIKLIGGLLRPTAGAVFYNGVDQTDVNVDSLHERIGLVMQENALFNTSIRENLRYGKDNASEKEMRDACEKAYILEFIDTLPDGLDTVIGERGLNLSAGQRQRLVLARLFLRSPDVYIFDEATSNLDSYSEAFIHDALHSIDSSKTILLISHRKSAWQLCDKVFSVETGQFIQ